MSGRAHFEEDIELFSYTFDGGKQMFQNKRIVNLFLVLSFAMVTAIFQGNALEASEAVLPKIGTLKVAYVSHFGFSVFFIAKEKGYFADQKCWTDAFFRRRARWPVFCFN